MIIIPTRLLLMKKQKGPRTLRSRPPINACPDATPSDARLNAASAPKVIVIAKTQFMGASLRERAAFNENICRFLCAKKRRNYPKTNAAGMSSYGSATVGSPQRFLFPISSTRTSARIGDAPHGFPRVLMGAERRKAEIAFTARAEPHAGVPTMPKRFKSASKKRTNPCRPASSARCTERSPPVNVQSRRLQPATDGRGVFHIIAHIVAYILPPFG